MMKLQVFTPDNNNNKSIQRRVWLWFFFSLSLSLLLENFRMCAKKKNVDFPRNFHKFHTTIRINFEWWILPSTKLNLMIQPFNLCVCVCVGCCSKFIYNLYGLIDYWELSTLFKHFGVFVAIQSSFLMKWIFFVVVVVLNNKLMKITFVCW